MRPQRRQFLAIAVLVSLTLAAGCTGDNELPATTTPAVTLSPTPTAMLPVEGTATPGAIHEPTYAPDGRTGIAELDEIIEVLLSAPVEELIDRFPEAEAWSQENTGPSPVDPYPVDEWSERLRDGGPATLRAVSRERPNSGVWPSREYNIVLSTEQDGRITGWRFAVERGSLVDIYFNDESPVSVLHLDPAGSYDLFLVLPPRDELPQLPASHPLSVRTGDAGVDRVLDLVQARDVGGLLPLTHFDENGRHLAEECSGWPIPRTERAHRVWLGEMTELAIGVHAVAVAPPGYRPTHGHLVSIRVQLAPLEWSLESMLISPSGELVRVIDGCRTEPKPPLAVLVPEPVGDIPAEERRTGIEAVDSFLDAMEAGDIDTMASLVDYRVIECVERSDGIGAPPTCEPGEAVGTPVKALLRASCEGYYIRESAARETLASLAIPPVVYAAWDLGEAPEGAWAWAGAAPIDVVLVHDAPPAVVERIDIVGQQLRFSERGLVSIWDGCGPSAPATMLGPGHSPEYLLPPLSE